MSSIECYGAVEGEVTGSGTRIITENGLNILVDLGLHQGTGENSKLNKELPFDPSKLDAIFLTHAHLDHSGLVPLLHKIDAPIVTTETTLALTRIALNNAQALSPYLYPNGSVERVLKKIQTVAYDSPTDIDGTTVWLRNAGHIAGSSYVELKEKCGQIIVVTGDWGNSLSSNVKKATPIKEADVIVTEATYGGGLHPQESPAEVIFDAVERIKDTNGTLLIPTFAIDRTQKVLYILKGLREKGKLGNMPVFLDSPMGMAVTEVYDMHRELLNEELSSQAEPFNFRGLTKTYTSNESRAIKHRKGPKIIIAGSGMMSGGRIGKHAEQYLPDSKNVILFVGYAAEETPGRAILDGEKKVLINDEWVSVNAQVLKTGALSAHADQAQLTEMLRIPKGGNRRLRQIIVVHAGDNQGETFAKHVKEELEIDNVSFPQRGKIIDLRQNSTQAA